MGHVTDGALRRYLDEPGSVPDDDRRHLAACTRCAAGLAAAGSDRDATAALLGPDLTGDGHPVAPGGLDKAWARLQRQLAAGQAVPVPTVVRLTDRSLRRRSHRYQVAAGVTAGLLVLGGTAAAAAADWLPIFHTESVAPVTVDADGLSPLTGLSELGRLADYGDLTLPAQTAPVRVADAAAATARSGIAVPRVAELPRGVTGDPEYYVVEHDTATFTFSATKAAATAAAHGASLPPVPAGLDGSTLKIEGGPAVGLTWLQSGRPVLVVGRSTSPRASAQGTTLATIRDYLLSVPGVPADLAAQLKAVTGDGTTLPVPVLKGRMTSSRADVNGHDATVLTASGGAGSGVVWVDGGRLTVVAGAVTPDDALAVARALR